MCYWEAVSSLYLLAHYYVPTYFQLAGFPMCPRFENRVSPDNVSWTDNTVGPLSVYYTVAVNSTDGVSMYNVTESTFSIPVNISQSNSSYSLKVEACVLGHCSPNCPWRDYSDDGKFDYFTQCR